MAELAAFESALEGAGFVAVRPEGSPEQLRWYHRPMSWRERMPMVRGFRRTVVVADLPVVRGERIDPLFAEIAGIVAGGLGEALGRDLKQALPWWGYPLFAVVLMVAVALTYFVGISIELQDHEWVLVVLPRESLSSEAQAAAGEAYGASEQFTAVAALWDRAQGRLLLPAPPPGHWGPHKATARAALKDLRLQLGPVAPIARI